VVVSSLPNQGIYSSTLIYYIILRRRLLRVHCKAWRKRVVYIAFRNFVSSVPVLMYSLQGINGATREIKGKRYFEERVAEVKFKAVMIQASLGGGDSLMFLPLR